MHWRSVLLLAVCFCGNGYFPEALLLRYRLSHGAIRKVSMKDTASVKDLHELLRSMSVLKDKETLRIDNMHNSNDNVLREDDAALLCADCISTDSVLEIASPMTGRQWGKKVASRYRDNKKHSIADAATSDVGEATGASLVLPSEALRVFSSCAAAGGAAIGIVVGIEGLAPEAEAEAGSGGARVRKGSMVFQIPFAGPNELVGATHISLFLEKLKEILIICKPFGYEILGIVVPGDGPLPPRHLLLSLLVGEFIGLKERGLSIIRASAEAGGASGKKNSPRRLMSRKNSESAVVSGLAAAAAAPAFLSVEGLQVAGQTQRWAADGALPNYFTSPATFMKHINDNSPNIRTLRPIHIANNELSEVDPILLIKNVPISLADSGNEHSFPAIDFGKQKKSVREIEMVLGRLYNHKHQKYMHTRIQTVLRDPQLLLFLLSNFYSDDISTFASMCRFLANDEDNKSSSSTTTTTTSSSSRGNMRGDINMNSAVSSLEESSFTMAIDMLRNMLRESSEV
jgi:hypothetical protein